MMESKRILFICNTYMQLITAIQIKEYLYKHVNADLILSDHSVNAEIVCNHLSQVSIFKRVFCAHSKEAVFKQNVLEDLKDVFTLTFNLDNKYKKMLWENDITYDAIFYYNHDFICIYAYDQSRRLGKTPKCVRFEEGIFSYEAMTIYGNVGKRMQWLVGLRRFMRKKNVFEETRDLYCYYPELLAGKGRKCHKIPLLNRNNHDLIQRLNTVFSYQPQKDLYPQKYLFFASSSDIDGNHVGETELVLRIADMVGKENLLVKKHPRDTRKVYEKQGITVAKNSAVPWEVIQLNHDFTDHIFLTVSSGSVLNASAMLEDDIATYFLYPCLKGKNQKWDKLCEQSIYGSIKKLQEKGHCQNHRIIEDIEMIK